jgi:hypothetical protein
MILFFGFILAIYVAFLLATVVGSLLIGFIGMILGLAFDLFALLASTRVGRGIILVFAVIVLIKVASHQ